MTIPTIPTEREFKLMQATGHDLAAHAETIREQVAALATCIIKTALTSKIPDIRDAGTRTLRQTAKLIDALDDIHIDATCLEHVGDAGLEELERLRQATEPANNQRKENR